MNQQRQHAVARIAITLNLLRKYHARQIPETGKEIQYDIQQLSDSPNALKLWYKRRTDQENKSRKHHET